MRAEVDVITIVYGILELSALQKVDYDIKIIL